MKKSILALSLSIVILAMAITGATLAWLQDTTDPVVNTFTEGKVDIELFEHEYSAAGNKLTDTKIYGDADADNEGNTYKMVPGDVLPKDPTVVVKEGSEACYVFVKVEEINDAGKFLTYTVDTAVWTPLADTNSDGVADDGVYYKVINVYTSTDTSLNVLTNKQVTVKTSVKMDDMKNLSASNYPQLKFTAYAIQSANLTDQNSNGTVDASDAWAALQP